MGLIKNLTKRIVLKDRFRSCVTDEEIKKFKKQAQITNPANYSKKIMPDKTLDEVINMGIEQMKKDGFRIATDEVIKGL